MKSSIFDLAGIRYKKLNSFILDNGVDIFYE